MWFDFFSVGALELVLVAIPALVTAALAVFRRPAWRWSLAVTVCTLVATVLTPSDPLSTFILGAVLLLFFVGGAMFARPGMATTHNGQPT